MSRIKIDIPYKFIFKDTLKVRITDINYGGHTGNDSIIRFMHEGRMNFLKGIGIKDEINIAPEIGLIVADLAVEYKSETFHGDEVDIFVSVDDFNKYGFNMFYRLVNKKTENEVAKGKTGIVFYNYKQRKIASIPPTFDEKIKDLLND